MAANSSKTNLPSKRQRFVEALYPLAGKALLNRILEVPDPQKTVQELAGDDFYWLIKRLDEDSGMVLAFASEEQWQYLLDLELWAKDRLDLSRALSFIELLQEAAPERLAQWLFSDGQPLAFYTLFKSIDVWIRDPDNDQEPEGDFITFEGVYYFRVKDSPQRAPILRTLKAMADEDQLKYQGLLLGLAGVLPAELEEDMYRMKTVRLAEHGFLPLEEALSIYAPLDTETLKSNTPAPVPPPADGNGALPPSPFTPLYTATSLKTFHHTLSMIEAPREQDRIRFEFAGLCNQLLSAEGDLAVDTDTLRRTCRKAGGYLNLALESAAKEDASLAESLLRDNPVSHLFRAGFTMALRLKWKAERWVGSSWFQQNELKYDFWPEAWAGTLNGLLAEKPKVFQRKNGADIYRDFEYARDLKDAEATLDRLMAMDRLLSALSHRYPLDDRTKAVDLKYPQLLFTLWARQRLNMTPAFTPISPEDMRSFFALLRTDEDRPPFEMPGQETIFVADMMAEMKDFSRELAPTLRTTLTDLWGEFSEEYRWVQADALDPRFSPYLLFAPSGAGIKS